MPPSEMYSSVDADNTQSIHVPATMTSYNILPLPTPTPPPKHPDPVSLIFLCAGDDSRVLLQFSS